MPPPTGAEALDVRDFDPATTQTVLSEIGRTSALFGGHAAVMFGFQKVLRGRPTASPLTILDVGAGGGDVLRRVGWLLGDPPMRPIALDHHRVSARMCGDSGITPIVADLRQLPVRPDSVDIAIVSLVLHHLTRDEAVALIAQLEAAARLGVVITDLRRSALAVALFDLAARALRLHDVTRRDGLLSIRRSFSATELADMIAEAGVHRASVHRRPGWRLVAYWRTNNAHD